MTTAAVLQSVRPLLYRGLLAVIVYAPDGTRIEKPPEAEAVVVKRAPSDRRTETVPSSGGTLMMAQSSMVPLRVP